MLPQSSGKDGLNFSVSRFKVDPLRASKHNPLWGSTPKPLVPMVAILISHKSFGIGDLKIYKTFSTTIVLSHCFISFIPINQANLSTKTMPDKRFGIRDLENV